MAFWPHFFSKVPLFRYTYSIPFAIESQGLGGPNGTILLHVNGILLHHVNANLRQVQGRDAILSHWQWDFSHKLPHIGPQLTKILDTISWLSWQSRVVSSSDTTSQ